MHPYNFSRGKPSYRSSSRRNESERWSFQTDVMPGSCQSRQDKTQKKTRDQKRESDVVPSAFINISGMKLGKSRNPTITAYSPMGQQRQHSNQVKQKSRPSNRNKRDPHAESRKQMNTSDSSRATWLENLKKKAEIRVPPKALTSRPKRFKPFGSNKDTVYTREKTARSSTKSKSSHNSERRRIQSLISSCNWDGMGKPDLYIFGKELGKGSFGVVKLAHHKITGQKVAIKVYDKTKFKKSSQIKRCRQEITLMSSLNSKKVTHLFEAYENSKKIYLVMEALSGGNLCTYVKSKKHLCEEEALVLLKQIIQALDFLHNEAGVVHRDIKLENILFTGKHKLKLADFGFSVFVENNEENIERVGINGTKKYLKSFCGTPSYMAPEIIRKKGYEGLPVDVWSLGVVYYAMLFGRFPFRARNHEDLYKLILSGRFSIPDSLADHVSSQAIELLKRMIVLDVRKRATILDLVGADLLLDVGSTLTGEPEPETRSNSVESKTFKLVSSNPSDDLKEDLLKQLVRFGFSYHRMKRHILNKERNHITATYYLLKRKYARKKAKKNN